MWLEYYRLTGNLEVLRKAAHSAPDIEDLTKFLDLSALFPVTPSLGWLGYVRVLSFMESIDFVVF